MSRRSEREDAAELQKVASRAVRRLDMLEWLILAGAMVIALAGGAAVAWILAPTMEVGFRPTWVVVSLLLFVVPGVIAFTRARKAERAASGLLSSDND